MCHSELEGEGSPRVHLRDGTPCVHLESGTERSRRWKRCAGESRVLSLDKEEPLRPRSVKGRSVNNRGLGRSGTPLVVLV